MKNKELKKSRKKYLVMKKKYTKELKRITKNCGPWEWSYIVDFIMTYVHWMREYYAQDYNILQADESRNTILTSLDKTIAAYENWKNVEDEYVKINDSPICDDGFLSIEKGVSIPGDTTEYYIKYKYENAHKTYEELHKESEKRKLYFFKLLGKNIESWWD